MGWNPAQHPRATDGKFTGRKSHRIGRRVAAGKVTERTANVFYGLSHGRTSATRARAIKTRMLADVVPLARGEKAAFWASPKMRQLHGPGPMPAKLAARRERGLAQSRAAALFPAAKAAKSEPARGTARRVAGKVKMGRVRYGTG